MSILSATSSRLARSRSGKAMRPMDSRHVDARVKAICLTLFVIAALHAKGVLAVSACVVSSVLVALLSGCMARSFSSILRPLLPILLLTAFAQVCAQQQGMTVISVGAFRVTLEGLWATARMVAVLFSIMVASISFMRCTTVDELVVVVRWMLSPFRVLGLRSDSFVLALIVAIRFVPVLVEDAERLRWAHLSRGACFDGGLRVSLESYMRLFGPLVRGAFRRADRLAVSCLARCFSCGVRPSVLRESRLCMKDISFCAGTIGVVGVMML